MHLMNLASMLSRASGTLVASCRSHFPSTAQAPISIYFRKPVFLRLLQSPRTNGASVYGLIGWGLEFRVIGLMSLSQGWVSQNYIVYYANLDVLYKIEFPDKNPMITVNSI